MITSKYFNKILKFNDILYEIATIQKCYIDDIYYTYWYKYILHIKIMRQDYLEMLIFTIYELRFQTERYSSHNINEIFIIPNDHVIKMAVFELSQLCFQYKQYIIQQS